MSLLRISYAKMVHWSSIHWPAKMIRDMKRYGIKGANVSVSIFCVCVYVRVYVCARGWVVCANAHSLSNTRIQSHVRLMQSKYTMNSHLSDGFDCIKSTDGWTCRRHKKYIFKYVIIRQNQLTKKTPYTQR